MYRSDIPNGMLLRDDLLLGGAALQDHNLHTEKGTANLSKRLWHIITLQSRIINSIAVVKIITRQ